MNEQEKINELMKPRYKIIAGWPICGKHNMPEHQPKIGGVYYCHSHDMISTEHWIIKNVSNYPHLFRKLEWWEERKPEEMPEYFKTSNDDFYKADEWNPDDHYGWIATSRGRCYHRSHILPATSADYQAFITKPVNQD